MTTKTGTTDKWAAQYKHPKWQKKRLEILERDGFTCNVCGSKDDQLHVHHIEYTYGAKVWEYENHNFMTLCESCHERVHKLKDSFKFILNECFREAILGDKTLEELELFKDALIRFFTQDEECPEYLAIISLLRMLGLHQQDLVDARNE